MGALTKEVMRLELGYLVKGGYIQKGRTIRSSISWTGGANISIESTYPEGREPQLKLRYTITSRGGEKTDYNYTIFLMEKPSNLGKGYVLYFLCPETGKPCRILYLAYGSTIFTSRETYSGKCRLYYEPQLDSRRGRANSIYWRIERQLEKMNKGRATYTYKGKPTRRALRLDRLREKKERADRIRWSILSYPVKIRNEILKESL